MPATPKNLPSQFLRQIKMTNGDFRKLGILECMNLRFLIRFQTFKGGCMRFSKICKIGKIMSTHL